MVFLHPKHQNRSKGGHFIVGEGRAVMMRAQYDITIQEQNISMANPRWPQGALPPPLLPLNGIGKLRWR